MITNHIVRESEIILYFDYSFEVGSFDSKEKKSILNQVYDYLKNTKINFDGKKIMLMIGSTLIATLIYTGNIVKLDNLEMSNPIVVETTQKEEVVQVSDNILNIVDENEKEETNIEKNEKVDRKEQGTKDNSNKQKVTKSEITNQSSTSKIPSKKQESSQPSKEEIKENYVKPDKTEHLVTIYRSNGTILEIELEEYIVGVVAAEMPASFNTEALKAQAVIARTYALKKQSRGEILTDNVTTQSYIDTSQMKSKWGSDYSKYYNKIVGAVKSTEGEYLTYNGEYIEAVYHSTSNGYTEDAVHVWGKSYPYLKSVESKWDKSVGSYLKITNKDINTVMNTLGINYDENTEVTIIDRSESGRVLEVKIGDKTYTGLELRTLLGLRSTDFDIKIDGDNLTIITRGYGHGVGMSQYGANGMAKEGYSYKDIINHYYSGIKLNK